MDVLFKSLVEALRDTPQAAPYIVTLAALALVGTALRALTALIGRFLPHSTPPTRLRARAKRRARRVRPGRPDRR
jgi:hypothetical protein